MAKVIFIESLDGDFPSGPTTRIGLDGNWMGAVRGASYYTFSVTPGEYTLCASRQSATQAERDNVATSPLNAKAGQVYFFEFKITRTEVGSLDRQGGSSLPQQYPGGMTAKDKPTSDQASLSSIDNADGEMRVSKLPVAVPAIK